MYSNNLCAYSWSTASIHLFLHATHHLPPAALHSFMTFRFKIHLTIRKRS